MLGIPESVQRPLLQAHEKHGRWLPLVATVLLTVVLARQLADFVWLWVPVPENARWRPPPALTVNAAPTAKGPDVQMIAAAHLFGDYQAPADPAVDEMEKAPDTRLALTLLGILAADEDRGSRALIGDSGGDEKPYSVGDKVPGGVTLQAIFPDRVILARNGQLETLRLDKDKPGAPLPPSARRETAASSTVTPETTELLSQVREQLLADPSKAANYIRVQPANIGGEQRGYRIYPGRDRSLFNSAGLRPGDIVTSVNGVSLNDPAQALQMLADLSQAPSLNLTIERGGNQESISVNFNQ
jgi:general secretion pathway protein C